MQSSLLSWKQINFLLEAEKQLKLPGDGCEKECNSNQRQGKVPAFIQQGPSRNECPNMVSVASPIKRHLVVILECIVAQYVHQDDQTVSWRARTLYI